MKTCTEFFTVSCRNKMALLQPEPHKMIILNSLQFLVKRNEIKLHAYVIMNNHFHLLWTVKSDGSTKRRFMSFIAHEIKKNIISSYPDFLSNYHVAEADREYNFFYTPYIRLVRTKLEANLAIGYIHNNSAKAHIDYLWRNYEYSSAEYYSKGIDRYGFLSRYEES
jgi:putative transposase